MEKNYAIKVKTYYYDYDETHETTTEELRQLFKENPSLLENEFIKEFENKFIKDIYDSLEENRKKRQRKRKGTP